MLCLSIEGGWVGAYGVDWVCVRDLSTMFKVPLCDGFLYC